jgi:hypothetical protein
MASSFKKDGSMVFYAYVVFAGRAILRLFNFENYEMTPGAVKGLFAQQVFCFFIVLGLFQFFPQGMVMNSYLIKGLILEWVIAELKFTNNL